jgi:hypothetical protein
MDPIMKHNKSALLSIIRDAVSSGEISRSDLEFIIQSQKTSTHQPSSMLQLVYYLGGIIVLIGLLLLLTNQWSAFGSGTRVAIAGGAILLSYYAAVLFIQDVRWNALAKPFFLIFAILLPVALAVVLFEGKAIAQSLNESYIFGLSLIACGWAFYCYRRTEILVFVVLYASLYYFSLLQYCHECSRQTHLLTIMALGFVYTYNLFKLWQNTRPGLAKAMSRIGLLLVFFALFGLREKTMPWHFSWDVVLILFLWGSFSFAFHRQDIFLKILGFLAFILYIFCFTSDYLSHSLGWPLSLIITGLVIIGVSFWVWRRKTPYVP